jgi:hypothetical protein
VEEQQRLIRDSDATPRRAVATETLLLDDEALLLDPRTARIHQLNPQATLIWSVLDGEGTVGDLVTDVADAFDVDADRMREDVQGLVAQLAAFDLLEGSDPAPHLLVGARPVDEDRDDGLWRPSYLFDPPAP